MTRLQSKPNKYDRADLPLRDVLCAANAFEQDGLVYYRNHMSSKTDPWRQVRSTPLVDPEYVLRKLIKREYSEDAESYARKEAVKLVGATIFPRQGQLRQPTKAGSECQKNAAMMLKHFRNSFNVNYAFVKGARLPGPGKVWARRVVQRTVQRFERVKTKLHKIWTGRVGKESSAQPTSQMNQHKAQAVSSSVLVARPEADVTLGSCVSAREELEPLCNQGTKPNRSRRKDFNNFCHRYRRLVQLERLKHLISAAGGMEIDGMEPWRVGPEMRNLFREKLVYESRLKKRFTSYEESIQSALVGPH